MVSGFTLKCTVRWTVEELLAISSQLRALLLGVGEFHPILAGSLKDDHQDQAEGCIKAVASAMAQKVMSGYY